MKAAEQTQANLKTYRSDDAWLTLWAFCTSEATQLNLDPPTVPRVRQPPRQLDAGGPPCIQSVEECHRVVFFQLLDNILQAIGDRLQQNTMILYATIEDTILSAANNIQPRTVLEAALETICNHFGNDLDRRKLCLNIEMLHDLMNSKVASKISDITEALNALGPA